MKTKTLTPSRMNKMLDDVGDRLTVATIRKMKAQLMGVAVKPQDTFSHLAPFTWWMYPCPFTSVCIARQTAARIERYILYQRTSLTDEYEDEN